MHSATLAENPLRTRDDLQRVMLELWRPLRPFLERQGAAVTLEVTESTVGAPTTMLETFMRPLWGVAALVAGGGAFPDAELCRRVLAEGVDPAHPRYWGDLGENDQRAVEMGALGAILWMAPSLLWNQLPDASRAHLVAWLQQINRRSLWGNNWVFFRVLANGALRSLGQEIDEPQMMTDLAHLNSHYCGDGWYADGNSTQFDYYIPWAMHLYGLIYARLSGKGPAPYAEEFRTRARLFAPQFAAWFARGGEALPFGRSLTYRFAQSSFWGALAFADIEALPWGVIKRLHLGNIRWWLRQPIFSETGLLTVGYRYPNLIMTEGYNAPGSPYWAAKAFLPLALPPEHPFWQAEESENAVPEIVAPRHGFVICRDEPRAHVFALANNLVYPAHHRFLIQKYGKFAYSTAFGFSVPVGGSGPRHGAGDNMLLVSLDGRDWRCREYFTEESANGHALHSRWLPWPEIEIDTWLAPAMPGHVRVHRIKSARTIQIFEGGFPLEQKPTMPPPVASTGGIAADNGSALSAIWDLAGTREAQIISPEPNTNLLYPLTVLPGLAGTIPSGETCLFTAVAGLPGPGQQGIAQAWRERLHVDADHGPSVRQGEIVVLDCRPAETTTETAQKVRPPKLPPSPFITELNS
ncbi:MAG: DUF2264 domain-containing protein [Opitutaceae bacterium]